MNNWILFVKKYAIENNIPYNIALQEAKQFYKVGNGKGNYISKLIATGNVDYNKIKNNPSKFVLNKQQELKQKVQENNVININNNIENFKVNIVDVLQTNINKVNKDALIYAIEVSLAEERNQKLTNLKQKKMGEVYNLIKKYNINEYLINKYYRLFLNERKKDLEKYYIKMHNYINERQKKSMLRKTAIIDNYINTAS
jgi:hypothetical protein